MRCPFCSQTENRVINSRLVKESNAIRRRRECISCRKRFTTYERIEESLPLVIKRDGRREPFDREKILSGIQRACEKRPISISTIEKIVGRIEQHYQDKGDREIGSTDVGERVMAELHDLDAVAYVRFASVYRQFRDLNDFHSELEEMLSRKEKEAEKAP